MTKSEENFIFILGDSRTGTMSLCNYLKRNSIPAVHYAVEESGCVEPLHEYIEINRENFFNFIDSSAYYGFSDYPVRFFYKELIQRYPKASYILNVRSSTEVWLKSLLTFLAKFGSFPNAEEVVSNYEVINDDIRKIYTNDATKFLEICIDDGDVKNGQLLSAFLGIQNATNLSRDNSTDSFDLSILSKRHTLYGSDVSIDDFETMLHPNKAFISEFGWLYLANDTNRFLQVQYGERKWNQEELELANETIERSHTLIESSGIGHLIFIIPEKSIVYSEYLPKLFNKKTISLERPANILSKQYPKAVYYLEDYLKDVKSYGLTYFRGDTHTNWLGSWFVYKFIIDTISNYGLAMHQKIINLSGLTPSHAAYDGDLFPHLASQIKQEYDSVWGYTNGLSAFEYLIKLDIPESARRAYKVEVPNEYKDWFDTRETLVYERPDGVGKKAVIFRDSTLDHAVDLIAQHFSRSVFIWHKGFVYDEVIEMEKPDIVLHVMAERFVTDYTKFSSIASIKKNN
jgi:hypothetical protein